jgi:hypothetical protein
VAGSGGRTQHLLTLRSSHGKLKEVYGNAVTCFWNQGCFCAETSRGRRGSKGEGEGRPAKPQKGMFRSRERNTALGGKDAEADPNRDPATLQGLVPEGQSGGERDEPHERRRYAKRRFQERARP